ncbi:unnamed protein product [Prorocentrum cordatum]|uniref:Erythromycin biosynthesis protein CIII-like C-terminal domain-containing protein n=1 Tax=Prorocentrum cordatum TaxID=2364126 RepID=A0ABN9UXQ8_9DINO|nr:unnamed protein product [Polarella glacialis]
MPWTATAEVGHPLSGPSTAQRNGNAYWHKMSYRWVDNLQWSLGRLGPFVNAFRREIGLAPISSVQYENAPSLVDELQVPFMYFFSRALLEKPPDWGPHIDVCGFLDDGGEAASGDATRPPALEAFLAAGAPPVYVGFGSISSDLEAIADAAVNAALGVGRRVVLQRGWGSLGSLHQRLPPDVFYVGRPGEEEELRERIAAGTAAVGALDHEWLFPRCRAVVHHGGCGTTQCGIRHARPCVVIAFFGDQPLWGGLVQHRGAGRLVLSRRATPRLLSEALVFACGGEAAAAAEGLRDLIREEAAAGAGLPRVVDSFHKQLPADLLACDVCAHMAHSSGGPRQEVRLARFFDTGSQLRLCDVCCYALFVHQAPEAAEGQPPPSARGPERLAVYRALDWGRGRRRWLRNLGASTAHAMEGVVAMPFVGLRSGGLVGAAVGGVAGLLNLLVAPISGARHLVNQLRSRDPLQEDPVSLQDMVHLRVDGGRLRVGAAGRAGDAVPGAAAEGLAGGRGEGPLFSRQQSDDEGLPISRRQGDLVARGEAQAGERIAPDDEAAVCSEIAEAFRGAIDFRERMLHVQAQGHEEFSAALAGADWSKGPASRALRSASGASSARSLPLLSPPPQRRGGSTSGAHGALLASPGCAGPPGAGAPG